MRITFLIGNGFDIGLGLHTRYEDFYPTYCKEKDTDNENIRAFKQMLSEREKEKKTKLINWADFEKAFGEHSADPEITDKAEYLERFEDFVTSFNAYLDNEVNQVSFENTDKIGRIMKNAVTTYFHIREDDKVELTELYGKNPGLREFCFVTFNYTHSVDECASALKKALANEANMRVGEVLHVHGYIDKNMIMGVNDSTQIRNPIFASDSDVISEIVKPLQNNIGKTAYDRKVTNLINSSDIICVYGMSLGDTDKKWWIQIVEWLEKKENHALVILMHHDKYDERFIFSQTKIISSTIARFLSFSDLDQMRKENIAKRIYVGGNHDVFAMKLRKQPTSQQDNPSLLSAISPNVEYLPPELLDAYKLTSEINALSPLILDSSLSKIAR